MKIAIIGSGAMGSGIAQVAATAGNQVILYDKFPNALKFSKEHLQKIMLRLQEKGRLTLNEARAIQNRIHYTDQLKEVAPVEMVIEAIVEDIEIKKSLFQELESLVSDTCILASNTSSLSITSIAAACKKHPGRVIGIHFFNPAPLMKLVEIIPAIQTASTTRFKAEKTLKSWGKTTVLAKDTPAFIVNRVARPFYSEALRIYEEGIADFATIDWAMTEIGGFRMGPFSLMDYIGNDVNYKVTETVFEAYYYDPRYKPSFTQKRLVEAGFLGRKTGKGFYNYTDRSTNPAPKKRDALGRQILIRILVMLINEAADTVFWQVATPEDIELAMTTGVNYPTGLLNWADELGIGFCVRSLDALYDEYKEDRYRCSPLLRRMAKADERFF